MRTNGSAVQYVAGCLAEETGETGGVVAGWFEWFLGVSVLLRSWEITMETGGE